MAVSALQFRVGILTMSDKGSRGEREDRSGEVIRETLATIGGQVVRYEVIPDEADVIEGRLVAWADSGDVDLIVTTGGTGLAPRDVTPEATLRALDKLAPGIPELMRATGLSASGGLAALSRGVAGSRGRTLIVNLPGSVRAVRESLAPLLEVLPHAVATVRGEVGDHPETP